MKLAHRLGVLLVGLACVVPLATQAGWNQWRGPGRDGHASAFVAPAAWPVALKLLWKISAGGGYSSPVASGGMVCLHARESGEETVSCHDLFSGRELWKSRYAAPFSRNSYAKDMQSGPFATPVLHDGRLYTFGVSGVVSAFDARNGKLLWRRDDSALQKTDKLFTGAAMSPLIEGGRLIVHTGDDRGGRLLALDLRTGESAWELQGDGPGYASPIAVAMAGQRQLVTMSDRSLFGAAAATGVLLWKVPFPDEWNENIVTPLLWEDLLLFSGVRQGTLAVRVSRDAAGKWEAAEVWRNRDLPMYMTSPVLDGGSLYGFSNKRKGQYFCLDARTGQARWTTEGRAGNHASMVAAGPFLFVLDVEGNLQVVRKNPAAFEPVARYKVAESAVYAHPVVLGSRVLIKDAGSLSLSSWE